MHSGTGILPPKSWLDEKQYQLLRRIAPAEPTHMDGSVYANGKSKLRTLLGDAILDRLRTAGTVIDFGCGSGSEAIELAKQGCRVIGVDIREEVLQRARIAAEAAGVAERCLFTTTPQPADAIVSIDSFEHFEHPGAILQTMHSMLRPGGHVYISFGPTWYHPLGGHLFSVFPWAHLLFSESALCSWRSHIRSDGATRFSEVEGGLNQMTISRFEQLVAKSPFTVQSIECVPIRRLAPLHSRLTREWTTALVRCTLVSEGRR